MSFTDPKCVKCMNEYIAHTKCDGHCRGLKSAIAIRILNVDDKHRVILEYRDKFEKKICGRHFEDPRDDLVGECRIATNEQIEKIKQKIKEM